MSSFCKIYKHMAIWTHWKDLRRALEDTPRESGTPQLRHQWLYDQSPCPGYTSRIGSRRQRWLRWCPPPQQWALHNPYNSRMTRHLGDKGRGGILKLSSSKRQLSPSCNPTHKWTEGCSHWTKVGGGKGCLLAAPSVGEWMDNLGYSHAMTYCSTNRTEWTAGTCNHILEHQIHHLKEKKPDSEGYVSYNTTLRTSWERRHLQEQKGVKWLPKPGSWGRDDYKQAGGKVLERRKYFTSWLWWWLSGCAFVKTHGTEYISEVNFTACEL